MKPGGSPSPSQTGIEELGPSKRAVALTGFGERIDPDVSVLNKMILIPFRRFQKRVR
jgi:hypothetical protein